MLSFDGVQVSHSPECTSHTELKPSRREAQDAFNRVFLETLNNPVLAQQISSNLDVIRRWAGLSNWEE